MDSTPLFSVITVTFNAKATLERTLRSAEQQTFRQFEHLIVDGGSRDGTLHLAQAYAERNTDLHIDIASEPDRGIYDAMNKGIKRARGQYLVFLNAGDKFHDADTLEGVARCIRDNRDGRLPAVVYGETDIVDNNGAFVRHRRLQTPKQLTWRSFMHGMLVCHQSFYALREIVPDYDLQYRFSADVDWCIRIMRQAKDMGMTLLNSHLILTDYLEEGQTTANHKTSLRERFRVMCHHYGLLPTLAMHVWFVVRSRMKR